MARGGKKNPTFDIVDPDATVEGQSVSQWTENWLKWAFYSPAENNPVYDDPTGQYAHVNNNGPVFFIAGAEAGAGAGEVERSFFVPSDTPVLLPILNNWVVDAPRGTDPVDEGLDSRKDNLQGMYATIDGKEIPDVDRFWISERDFTVTAPEGSYLDSLLDANNIPNETYDAGVDGYWLMLDNLSKGRHVLEFGGYVDWNDNGRPDPGETLDVTAKINVVPEVAVEGTEGPPAMDAVSDTLLI